MHTFQRLQCDGRILTPSMVRLRAALRRNEFRVAVQPIVCLDKGGRHGCEILLRWSDGPPPGVFVPAAERAGMSQTLGLWVLERAVAIATRVHAQTASACPLSVNVSAGQLDDPDFASKVATALTRHNLNGSALCLELTETSALGDLKQAAETIRRLRQMGCPVGLDDFGTGHSTLHLLHELPVSFIKLDRTFVSQLHTVSGRIITEHFLSLARHLRLGVVAEGVETELQAQVLHENGVRFAQGFLYARPAVLETDYVPAAPLHVCNAGLLIDDLGRTPLEPAS